jgi:hypothetical protein
MNDAQSIPIFSGFDKLPRKIRADGNSFGKWSRPRIDVSGSDALAAFAILFIFMLETRNAMMENA